MTASRLALVALLAALAALAPTHAAQARDPVVRIHLPIPPGGQTDGEDDVKPGEIPDENYPTWGVCRRGRAEIDFRRVRGKRLGPWSPGRYEVRPGDTLWSIVRARVSADATDQAVAGTVTRLWRINARRLEPRDRNALLPGDILCLIPSRL